MDKEVGKVHWRISGKQPIPVTIVFGNKFVAIGSINIVKKKHFHMDVDRDTYDIIMEKDECEFSIHGIVKGLAAFVMTQNTFQDGMTEVMIEEVMLTLGK